MPLPLKILCTLGVIAYCAALWLILDDIGIAITGTAAIVAFLWGRGRWLRHLLMLGWAISLALHISEAAMAEFVLAGAAIDLTLAGAALAIWTHNPSRTDARIVGGMSIALMPLHWVVSVANGTHEMGWIVYATATNGVFVLQCLIVRGWLDGLGRSIGDFVHRLRPVRLLRNRN